MKKIIILILIAGIFAGIVAFFNLGIFIKPKISDDASIQQINPQQNLESKIDDQANVTVVVAPLDISPKFAEWKFDIGMNTHSVELDQDLMKIAALFDDNGKEYKPIRYEGAGTGGHHREGMLVFNKISPTPKFVKLKISGVGGVVRIFSWQLK